MYSRYQSIPLFYLFPGECKNFFSDDNQKMELVIQTFPWAALGQSFNNTEFTCV